MISIEVLACIESELRRSSGNPKLVLADYFDYVAGTSTRAIIATLIALGYSTNKIRDFYLRSGAEMFHKARLWQRFRTKFESYHSGSSYAQAPLHRLIFRLRLSTSTTTSSSLMAA